MKIIKESKKLKEGILMAMQKFDESYDKENCIDSCRFLLMLKMKGINEY